MLLSNIKDGLKTIFSLVSDKVNQPEIEYQEKLNKLKESDKVAKLTNWDRLELKGSKYKDIEIKEDKTNKLLKIEPNLDKKKSFLKIVTLILFIYGIGIILDEKTFYSIGRKLIYFIITIILYVKYNIDSFKSKIFNKRYEVYYLGLFSTKKPDSYEKMIKFKKIHAIQLLSKGISKGTKKGLMDCFEINLILKNGERINLANYSGLNCILKDAKILSEYLNIPIWDGIRYHKRWYY